MIHAPNAVIKLRSIPYLADLSFMDLSTFIKTVPAVIGIAGLLTYFMRKRAPDSELQLVNIVQNLRNTAVVVGCAALIILSVWLIFRPAPPDHDAALSTPPAFAEGSNNSAMPSPRGAGVIC
jgi:hypothetical protein